MNIYKRDIKVKNIYFYDEERKKCLIVVFVIDKYYFFEFNVDLI